MLASRQQFIWTIPKDPKFSWIVPLTSSNNRAWRVMSDDELVKYARKFIEEEGIKRVGELRRVDKGLYLILRRRGLINEIKFEEKMQKKRNWNSMSDEELVEYTKKFVEERRISGRYELEKTDKGLYQVLMKRGLLDEIELENKNHGKRNWKAMTNDEVVEHTKKFVEEKKMSGRFELEKADTGLYDVLRKRGLLDEVGFEEKYRDWASMSDEEIVGYVRKLMEEKGINGRRELNKADSGLYSILKRRKLLNDIGFEEKQRNWASMSNDEIVEYAKGFMREERIKKRRKLRNANNGLYSALWRRKLLDRVFSSIDQSRRREAILQVVEAMEEFSN
ncbi:hypothetical protein KKB44_06240 [Candidatus Micrarchaeota archaeon]|nr:hypothetical protein [Candidatus Micrarchaeota archaeon]